MEGISQATLQVITLVVMMVGLFGLMVPVLPGLVIIWAAALIYGLISGFTGGSIAILVVMFVLMVVGSLSDNFIMAGSARVKGASWWSIGVAIVALILGSLVFPPFGGLVTGLLALFGMEFYRLKDVDKAIDTTRSMAMGCGWAVILRVALGVVMILMWGAWVMFL